MEWRGKCVSPLRRCVRADTGWGGTEAERKVAECGGSKRGEWRTLSFSDSYGYLQSGCPILPRFLRKGGIPRSSTAGSGAESLGHGETCSFPAVQLFSLSDLQLFSQAGALDAGGSLHRASRPSPERRRRLGHPYLRKVNSQKGLWRATRQLRCYNPLKQDNHHGSEVHMRDLLHIFLAICAWGACKLGIHSWDGCVCTRCYERRRKREDLHTWIGCKCKKCGRTRDKEHDWSRNCKVCSRCEKAREAEHSWDRCKCVNCQQTRDSGHSWNRCICAICKQQRHLWNNESGMCNRCYTSCRHEDYEYGWAGTCEACVGTILGNRCRTCGYTWGTSHHCVA